MGHDAAQDARRARQSQGWIQKWLGHSPIKITMDIHGQSIRNMQGEAAAAVDVAMRAAINKRTDDVG